MKILIIGGTGFIGSFLVPQLANHELTLLHRGNNPDVFMKSNIKHLIANRSDLPTLRSQLAVEKYDVAVDMISSNGEDANVIVNALNGIIKKIVVVSSGSVYKSYGRFLGTEPGAIIDEKNKETAELRSKWYPYADQFPRFEDDPLTHLKTYDKIPVEETYQSAKNLNFCIVRLPYVYGPGDKDRRVAHYLKRMAENKEIFIDEVIGNWKNSRSYVENVAIALRLVIEGGYSKSIYNISSLEDLTEKEWIERIAASIGWNGEVKVTSNRQKVMLPLIEEFPEAADYKQHLMLDSHKIRTELNFKEEVDLETGLQRTIQDAKGTLDGV
jgi:nucleoside-diphosphate-sugar epimerase